MITSNSLYFASPNQFEDDLDCYLPKFETARKFVGNRYNDMLMKRASDYYNDYIKLKLLAISSGSGDEKSNATVSLRDFFYGAYVFDWASQISFSQIYCKVNKLIKEMVDAFSADKTDIAEKIIYPFLVEINDQHIFPNLKKKQVAISCWHDGTVELDAMWKLYSKSDGIAIETTVSKLTNNLDLRIHGIDSFYSEIGRVNYTDLVELNEEANKLHIPSIENRGNVNGDTTIFFPHELIAQMCFSKRESFRFEKEIRIVLVHAKFPFLSIFPKDTGTSISFKNNIIDTIDKIIISPYAPDYYFDTIKNLLYNIGNPNKIQEIYHAITQKINKSQMIMEKEILTSSQTSRNNRRI
jgi:hypothetical protein